LAVSVRIGRRTRATRIVSSSGQSAAISRSMVVLLAGTISSAFVDMGMVALPGQEARRTIAQLSGTVALGRLPRNCRPPTHGRKFAVLNRDSARHRRLPCRQRHAPLLALCNPFGLIKGLPGDDHGKGIEGFQTGRRAREQRIELS
jgi:hypothetical protein